MGGSFFESKNTQQTSGDPAIAALNRLISGAVGSSFAQAGGLPGLTSFRPGAVPGQEERDVLTRIANLGRSPIPSFSTSLNEILGATLPAAQRHFGQITAPATTNAFTAGGFTPGSGAVAEALANAAAGLTLPLTTQASGLAATLPFAQREAEFGGLERAFEALGIPRRAQLTEESQLRDLLLSFFGRPLVPSGEGTTTLRQRPSTFDTLTKILQGLATAGAGAFAPGAGGFPGSTSGFLGENDLLMGL